MTTGTLSIVATPIGNIQDISSRALATLTQADIIFCEDTRHSAPLLSQYGIKTKTQAYHEFNETEAAQRMVALLQQGYNLALISDAGTPLINDPGYVITALCHEHGIRVEPIPGCCAFVTALSASGMASDSFTYFGFLPAKSKQRLEQFELLQTYPYTAIFYESTHRIEDSIKDLISVLGSDRKVCLARELTKQFETIYTNSASQVLEYLQADPKHKKGEFVIIVDKGQATDVSLTPEIMTLLKSLVSELPPKVLTKHVAKAFNLDKKVIYDYVTSLPKQGS